MADSAHRAHDRLHHFGVRGRLLLAFFGISSFAVLAAAAAVYVFLQIGGVLDRITEQRVPSALASLGLSRQAERIVAAAPPLLAATTEAQRDAVAQSIRAEVDRMEELLARLQSMGLSAASLAEIEPAVGGLRDNLDALDSAVTERLRIVARKNQLLKRLAETMTATQRLVAPGVLRIGTEIGKWRSALDDPNAGEAGRASATDDLTRAVAAFTPLQGAQFEISALNDALLRTSAAVSIADLRTLAFPIERSLYALEAVAPSIDDNSRPRFVAQVAEFKALVKGPESIPAARENEIAVLATGAELLNQNAALSRQLTAAVDGLVAAADQDIEQAGQEANAVQRTGIGALFAMVALSLLSSAAIVWLYVGRNLIARLRALSDSMLAIAGGNLRAPLPPPIGRDEIAGMADALRVFRDTAVEVEEQSLRERQVVLDTIDYGVLILGPELRVRMSNRAFRELWGISEEKLRGRPAARELLDSMRDRGVHGVPEAEWSNYAERRMAEIRAGTTPPQEWMRPDGRVLQYEIVALPDGGRMLTYFDLTQLKQVEAELRAAKEQAEMASNAKSAFVASMSHELRTPLNAIIGITEMLKEDAELDGRKDQEEPLGRVLRAGRLLLELINDVLDLAKIEAGKFELHPETVDLKSLLTDVMGTAEPLAERKANRLALFADADLGELHTDPMRLRQILLNLLSNACKFTERGDIRVTARREANGGSVVLEVSDTGVGMAADQLTNLFQEFSQIGIAKQRKYGGTGLGLAISRRLARLMGGDITVSSEPDRGSTFTLVLPRAIAQAAEAA